jgi:DMSO/TMAO reductase YedYZ molybdopterin-dependent catalytic subunit
VKFFERNRKELEAKGIDPARLPPGQYATERFPVLDIGDRPTYRDLALWDLRIWGHVERPVRLTWEQLLDLPAVTITTDIHCVTKWSMFDTTWKGVELQTVLDLASPLPGATHVLEHAEGGYTTNVPLADVTSPHRALLAYEYGGKPLEPDHGYPLRLLVPHLYFW